MTTKTYAFTLNALDLIASRLESAENPGDFLREVDVLLEDQANLLVRPDTVEPSSELKVGHEPENARVVFEALGAMDRANAADGRLWTHLAFTTFRPYMSQRWPLDPDKNWRGRVADRWLMPRATRQNLVRHGIARLWWIPNLTYDAHLSNKLSAASGDPYAYSDWVFAYEDRVQAIFEREAGSAPQTLVAAIDAMAAVTTRNHGDLVKDFMKEVTAASAYRSLDLLDRRAIVEVMMDLIPDRYGAGPAN
ncbi:hypothetical protein PROP_01305 [Propionicimonas sp. T2.31MG-18]|uniref:DUF6339 family protein n=1 Tax=Propionicimonas sp. T2.31MG-18 TaxID=3157620 RepID=UPI0035E6867D